MAIGTQLPPLQQLFITIALNPKVGMCDHFPFLCLEFVWLVWLFFFVCLFVFGFHFGGRVSITAVSTLKFDEIK